MFIRYLKAYPAWRRNEKATNAAYKKIGKAASEIVHDPKARAPWQCPAGIYGPVTSLTPRRNLRF